MQLGTCCCPQSAEAPSYLTYLGDLRPPSAEQKPALMCMISARRLLVIGHDLPCQQPPHTLPRCAHMLLRQCIPPLAELNPDQEHKQGLRDRPLCCSGCRRTWHSPANKLMPLASTSVLYMWLPCRGPPPSHAWPAHLPGCIQSPSGSIKPGLLDVLRK